MSSPFKEFSTGSNITGTPHSVLLSLPTMEDIINYENQDESILKLIHSGYPRFCPHELILKLEDKLADQLKLKARKVFLTGSLKAAKELLAFCNNEGELFDTEQMQGVHFDETSDACVQAKYFLQHTGCKISSREAEDLLTGYAYPEVIHEDESAEDFIRKHISNLYKADKAEDIYLTRSGMNAFYSAFKSINAIQTKKGKDIWIQLGWLYVDTSRILSKMLASESKVICHYDVLDLEGLVEKMSAHKGNIAGIITEVPTNPLVQVADLEKLRNIADEFEAALVLDPSITSAYNVNILPYADIHANSLTKYAANEGDVMYGAVALRASSPFYQELKASIADEITAPYWRDSARIAYQMQFAQTAVNRINNNTIIVARFLEKHPKVDKVFWAYSEDSYDSYNKIAKGPYKPGAIISFTLKTPIAEFYDKVKFLKSPSFGINKTIVSPFLYLAHYDEIKTNEGRERVRSLGLEPDLLRISVGTENSVDILEELQSALD